MYKKIHITILLSLVLLALVQCKHESVEPVTPNDPNPRLDTVHRTAPTNTCDSDSVYFENRILKLIVTKCAMTNTSDDCHGGPSYPTEHSGAIKLESYQDIMNHVIPYDTTRGEWKPKDMEWDWDDKLLVYRIHPAPDKQDEIMPEIPYPKLTNEEYDDIIKWILQGAKNNKCEPCMESDTGLVSFEEDVVPLLFDNCSGCHNDRTMTASGYYSLFRFPPSKSDLVEKDVKAGIDRIISKLIFSSTDAQTAMPRYMNKMYECEIQKLQDWANQ